MDGQKLFTGAGALTALIVTLGFIAWRSSASIQERLTETGNHTARRLSLSLETQADIERLYAADAAMLAASMANDAAALAAHRANAHDATTEMTGQLTQLAALMRIESGKRAVATVREQLTKHAGFQQTFESMLGSGRSTDAYQLFRQQALPLHDASMKAIGVIVANQSSFLTADMSTASDAYDRVRLTILATFTIALVIAFGFAGARLAGYGDADRRGHLARTPRRSTGRTDVQRHRRDHHEHRAREGAGG